MRGGGTTARRAASLIVMGRHPGRLAIGLAALGLALSGCASLGPARMITVPTSPPGVGLLGCPAALLAGQLVADERWGVALATEAGAAPVRWPSGYYARQGAVLTLHDAAGRAIASQGETLYVGGGMDEAGELFVACGYVSRDAP